MENKREVWQRGPVENIPALLQPVAHTLLQVGEEAHKIMEGFSEKLLWEKPAGVAAPAFHLQHIGGVIDRLFTYARKELLSEDQMHSLSLEGDKEKTALSVQELLQQLDDQINRAIVELKQVNEDTLTEVRGIGRKQIPTTLIGLYFHTAEHSMRHIGQLLVTVRVLKSA
ncbi:MAG: DinB family protein [Ginsengibacter sp.]